MFEMVFFVIKEGPSYGSWHNGSMWYLRKQFLPHSKKEISLDFRKDIQFVNLWIVIQPPTFSV